MPLRSRRLGQADRDIARTLFAVMARVFGEGQGNLSDSYLDGLLGQDNFWAFAAFDGNEIIGGLTAHTLPMTRNESSEIFIYDLAVRADHQRKGVGRQLVQQLRDEAAKAGIDDIFVPADDDDTHALDFYRALGATASPVTHFTFSGDSDES